MTNSHRRRSQRDPVELSFLKAVEHKLYCAYSNSSFVQFRNFDNAVTFHIPSSDYDDKLKESALWKLWELELRQRQEDDESDGEEESELLLKTRELTKELQGDWAASHPEMKNVRHSQCVFKLNACGYFYSCLLHILE